MAITIIRHFKVQKQKETMMDSAGFDFAMKINPDSPYAEDINNDAMNIRKKSHGMKGFFAKLFGKEE